MKNTTRHTRHVPKRCSNNCPILSSQQPWKSHPLSAKVCVCGDFSISDSLLNFHTAPTHTLLAEGIKRWPSDVRLVMRNTQHCATQRTFGMVSRYIEQQSVRESMTSMIWCQFRVSKECTHSSSVVLTQSISHLRLRSVLTLRGARREHEWGSGLQKKYKCCLKGMLPWICNFRNAWVQRREPQHSVCKEGKRWNWIKIYEFSAALQPSCLPTMQVAFVCLFVRHSFKSCLLHFAV